MDHLIPREIWIPRSLAVQFHVQYHLPGVASLCGCFTVCFSERIQAVPGYGISSRRRAVFPPQQKRLVFRGVREVLRGRNGTGLGAFALEGNHPQVLKLVVPDPGNSGINAGCIR